MKCPIGKSESDEKSSSVPVVHPQLCVSVDHFTGNTMFLDGKYRPLDEQFSEKKSTNFLDFQFYISISFTSRNSLPVLFSLLTVNFDRVILN